MRTLVSKPSYIIKLLQGGSATSFWESEGVPKFIGLLKSLYLSFIRLATPFVYTRTKQPLNTRLSKTLYLTALNIWNYLIKKGTSPRNAAAILGNIMQESSLDRYKVQDGGDKAVGWFLMHGNTLKAYERWKSKNPHGEYPELDYVEYVISSLDHPYTNEYLRVKSNPELDDYRNEIYGERERKGTLYLIGDLNKEWYSDSMSLEDITDLFENTIERGGNPVYENRRKYALDFYNHFYGTYE